METLPATLEDTTSTDLAILTGTASTESTHLASLGINYQKEDGGVKLPRGVWRLDNGDEVVFGTILTTKIMGADFQVREYDSDDNKYVGETILYRNGYDLNIEDDQGGYRCGKVTYKVAQELPKVEKAAQKAKKFYRVLLGVATLKGKNAEGKKAIAENVPFIMRLRGNSLDPINEYLESFKKVGNVHDYVTNWTIKEGEGGNVDYWIAIPEMGKESPIMENPTEYETLKGLMEWRQEYNDDIMSKWRKKNGMNVSKTLEAEAIEVAAVVIEPEMDDEIPF
jgi:hypothetical protein